MIQTELLDLLIKLTKTSPPSVTNSSKDNLLIFSVIAEYFYCVAWQLDSNIITGKQKPPAGKSIIFNCEYSKKQVRNTVISMISTFPFLSVLGFFS